MSVEAGPDLFDIHRAFAETEYGQTLAAKVRYERYKPADVSNERWAELLGADVNNLTHMPLTYGLTRSMVHALRESQPGFLTTNEEQLLLTAALIHDWGEALVGDITYSDKTADDEIEESRQLDSILNEFSAHEAAEVQDLIAQAKAEVIFSPESRLGHVFNTVERVGYMRTALRAAKHVLAGTAPDCEDGFRWIVADVMGNHPVELIKRVDTYLPVRTYLMNVRVDIARAFTVVEDQTFRMYPSFEQQRDKVQAFDDAVTDFHIWCLTNPK